MKRRLFVPLGLSVLLIATVGGTALAHVVTNNGFTLFNEATPDPSTVGQQMAFDITETNASGHSQSFVNGISDFLPAGVTFVTATVDKSGGTCSFDAAQSVVNCKGFDLPNGQTATMLVIVKPTVAGTFTNRVDDFGLAGTVDEPFMVNEASAGGGGGVVGGGGSASGGGVVGVGSHHHGHHSKGHHHHHRHH